MRGSSSKYWALMVEDPDDGQRPVMFPVCRKCAHDPDVLREAASSWGAPEAWSVPIEIVDHRRAEHCGECDRPLLVTPTRPSSLLYGGNVWDYIREEVR